MSVCGRAFWEVVGYGHDTSNWKDGATVNFFVLRSWLQAKLGRDERGANLVEYILLVALIALAVIAAVSFLGRGMTDKFNNEGSVLSSSGS